MPRELELLADRVAYLEAKLLPKKRGKMDEVAAAEIVKFVCDYSKVSIDDVMASGRPASNATAEVRFLCYYIVKSCLSVTNHHIAFYFRTKGNSVRHGIRRAMDIEETDPLERAFITQTVKRFKK